jgi:hypothetical protein
MHIPTANCQPSYPPYARAGIVRFASDRWSKALYVSVMLIAVAAACLQVALPASTLAVSRTPAGLPSSESRWPVIRLDMLGHESLTKSVDMASWAAKR